MWNQWKPYVTAVERRRKAEREVRNLSKKGHPVSPVVTDGRTIARTFWGKSWCDNLEGYSDYANRLPRGRTYVRNGSVLDLQIAPGEVQALVSGSEIYRVAVKVSVVPKARWTSICTDCAAGIDSLVELLQGRFSKAVMERICRQKTGLFPAPAEIQFSCSCPDWASMCKHVAAVLYGIGARLDDRPELLFHLRRVDEKDLIAKAGSGLRLFTTGPAADRVLAADGLSELFGLEMTTVEDDPAPPAPAKPARGRSTKPKAGAKKAPPKRRVAGSASTPGPAGKPGHHTDEKRGRPPKKVGAVTPVKKKKRVGKR
ncbi:MAG: SWIM zinc finger family protein [Gammaproteobacteria bacterium]